MSTKKPYHVWFFKGNTKVGKMLTWNKLAGNTKLGAEGCQGTCGSNCSGCWNADNWKKSSCYVAKSYYRYPQTVIPAHVRNTLAMRTDMTGTFDALDKQLTRAKIKLPVRLHSSGELESVEELRGWCELAKKHTDRPFYVYTKAYDVVNGLLGSGYELPENMWINISIWHEKGIECYKKWGHLANIRAFVYDDKYDYASHGIETKVHCPAYTKEGKMDHSQTCDVCGWCYGKNAGKTNKVIACYDHS